MPKFLIIDVLYSLLFRNRDPVTKSAFPLSNGSKSHQKHNKRTRSESFHLQYAHKPVNWRTRNTNGKETNQKNKGNKDDKTSRTLITPQSNTFHIFISTNFSFYVDLEHNSQ